jgi:hypothetical protein
VPRILSGVQLTGNTHLGNYVGARRSDRKGLGAWQGGMLGEQVFAKREVYGP